MSLLRLFRLVYVGSQRIGARFTRTGLGVVTLAAFAGAFGLDTAGNASHLVFALALLLLVADFMLTRHLDAAVGVERILPEFATVGQPCRYTLIVRNHGDRPLTGLQLDECLGQPFPTLADLGCQPSVAANRFDRAVGYPDWIDHLQRLRALDVPSVTLPPLAPGARAEIVVSAMPTARGLATFEAPRLSRPGALGLCRAGRRLTTDASGQAASLAVLPQRIAVDLPAQPCRRQLQPGGLALAMRVGDSEEFRSLRDYRPGDPLRAIHWRSWARTGKPVVREYHDEFFARHALVLDTEAPGRFDPALETAVALAVSLVVRPRETDSLLDMIFVAGAAHGPGSVHRLTAGRGIGHEGSLLRVLVAAAPAPPASFAPLARSVVAGAARVDSLVCIFLAWDDERRRLVRELRTLGLSPTVFVVSALAPQPDDAGVTLRHVLPGPTDGVATTPRADGERQRPGEAPDPPPVAAR